MPPRPILRRPSFRVTVTASILIVASAGVLAWNYGRPEYLLLRAQRDLDADHLDSAIARLKTAVDMQPDRAQAYFFLGKAYRRADRLRESAECLARARALGWPAKIVEREVLLGEAQSGRFTRSEPMLRALLQAGDPHEEEICEAFARGYLNTLRLQAASDCVQYWVRRRPDDFRPYFWRGRVWEKLTKWEQARQDYQTAIRLHPDSADLHRRLAEVFYQSNQLDGALAELQTCTRLGMSDPEVLLKIAQCERRLGRSAQARDALDQVLARDPNGWEGLVEMGYLELEANRPAEALAPLERAGAIAPYETTLHYALGQALVRLGRTKEAETHFRREQEIRANFERLANLTVEIGRHPQDADLRYQAGMILMNHGHARDAVGWFMSALQCDPSHQDSHAALATYYESVGNLVEAASHRCQAESAGRPDPEQSPGITEARR